jgi:hypothetical protein
MRRGTYIGPVPSLRGKEAALRETAHRVLARFDDPATGMTDGWHEFAVSEFHVEHVLTDVSSRSAKDYNNGGGKTSY